MTTDPSAALAAIREGYRAVPQGNQTFTQAIRAASDIPRLVAALDAVLKLTEPSGEVHRDLDGNEENGLIRVVRCDAVRDAITTALTGEDT